MTYSPIETHTHHTSGARLIGCVLLGLSFFAFNVAAQGSSAKAIVRGAPMRLAGTHAFTVKSNRKNGEIRWQVDREETDENGGTPTLVRNVASKAGATVSFDLPKIPNRETVYLINARGKNFDDTERVQIFPPNVRASFMYKSTGNPDVLAYIVVPSTLNRQTRIVMVMHGRSRNADGYIDTWLDWAARNNYIAIAPRFDDKNWNDSRGYNLGNVLTKENGAGKLNPESKWSFTIVEDIHRKARNGFGTADEMFDLFGHSAGGQFVHRFMLFKPQAKVRFAFPANSGWYTMPDPSLEFSYGVKHPLLSFTKSDLRAWTNESVIILRGTADTERTESLRQTPEADAQGKNRFERAGYMFAKVKALNPRTSWQLIDVPGADHDQRKMAPAAQEYLRTHNASRRFRAGKTPNEKGLRREVSANQRAHQLYLQATASTPSTADDWLASSRLLEEAVALDANHAPTLAALGNAYLQLAGNIGNGTDYYRRAEDSLRRALRLNNKATQTLRYLASLNAKTGKSEEAATLLLQALRLDPNAPDIHATLGYLYRYAGLPDESIRAYQQSQTLDASLDNLTGTQGQITKALIYKGNYQLALASHEKVVGYYKARGLPVDHKELFYAGVIYFYLKDYDRAVARFDAAAALDPTSIWTEFGQVYKEAVRGTPERVGARAKQLETRDIVDGERGYRLAHFYAFAGRGDDALRSLRKAIDGGFFNYPYIARDPLLESLRGKSQFKITLAQAKGRHDAFRRRFGDAVSATRTIVECVSAGEEPHSTIVRVAVLICGSTA